ncbi:hypothetical protein ACP4OV_015146 [Aristida adscensionis]
MCRGKLKCYALFSTDVDFFYGPSGPANTMDHEPISQNWQDGEGVDCIRFPV